MLKLRIPIAIALIASLLVILWLDNGTQWKIGCHLLLLFITILALHETYSLIENNSDFTPVKSIGMISAIALWAGDWLSYHPALYGTPNLFWMLQGTVFGLTFFLLLAYHAAPERQRPSALGNIATTLFGLIYIWLLGSYLIKIAMLEYAKAADFNADWDIGISCLFITIMTAKFSDVGAYLFGRKIGRHKLAPTISPNKTIEGAVAGLATSLLVAFLIQKWLKIPFLDWTEVILFGIVIGITGQLGDLAESLFKRICQAKDSANLLPGFGGVLDVIDSLLAAAPMAYVLFHLFGRVSVISP